MEDETRPSNKQVVSDVDELRRRLADHEAQLDEFARLASRVRHEINNPLTGLLGQAQLLLRDDLSEKARHRVETIVELSTRIRDAAAELKVVPR